MFYVPNCSCREVVQRSVGESDLESIPCLTLSIWSGHIQKSFTLAKYVIIIHIQLHHPSGAATYIKNLHIITLRRRHSVGFGTQGSERLSPAFLRSLDEPLRKGSLTWLGMTSVPTMRAPLCKAAKCPGTSQPPFPKSVTKAMETMREGTMLCVVISSWK